MNNDPEQFMARLKPQRTSAELRSEVLSVVAGQLLESRSWRLQKRLGIITLAMVILSVGLNFWVNQTVSQRIAALFPPPAPPREAVELAAFISKYTNFQAGQWVYQQMTSSQSSTCSPEDYFVYLQKIAEESEFLFKDPCHEKSEKNSPLDRHQPGDINRNPADMRGMLFLDHRFTA